MILVDTAPLIALIDRGQKHHALCLKTYKTIDQPMLTTWCCFTEAMYFLYQLRGWQAQQTLWQFLNKGALQIHTTTDSEMLRMQQLMERYQDTPMDIADASLVATAESQNLRRIFTLDSDFYVYRFQDNQAFIVIPDTIV